MIQVYQVPAKPASFSEEAATEICQMPVEVLDELSDAGLLESIEPGRYILHPVIADYGRMHHSSSFVFKGVEPVS